MPKADLETILLVCEDNQCGFRALDEQNVGRTRGPITSNAAYILQQAQNYVTTREMLADEYGAADDRGIRALQVHSRSDLSRIAALVVRECGANGWDFLEVLTEGVAYEMDVLKDIAEGRRKPDSHKGKDLVKHE